MLEIGIDEITLVLKLAPGLKSRFSSFDWQNVAEDIIDIFSRKADFVKIYGDKLPEKKILQGYTRAYTYGEHNFYLCVAYHEYQMSMGIAVRFSAQALDYYCEASGLKVYQFLQKVKDDAYTARLSRIDLTADYIDEGINITGIYQNLMDKKIGIFREYVSKKTGETAYRKCVMQFQGYIKECDVPTIYIGSVQSNSRLRIYDKKREQIEQKGTKLDKAVQCHDWVRFEGVFRHEFAHQLTSELLKVQSDNEFENLIACTLVQKYRFMYMDNGVVDYETEYTQMLLDCIRNQNFALKAPSSRNYDIAKSVGYLFGGSGVMNTLYKIKEIWGDDAIVMMLDYISGTLNEWQPNADCRYWLIRNAEDYRKKYPDFHTFLITNLSIVLPYTTK